MLKQARRMTVIMAVFVRENSDVKWVVGRRAADVGWSRQCGRLERSGNVYCGHYIKRCSVCWKQKERINDAPKEVKPSQTPYMTFSALGDAALSAVAVETNVVVVVEAELVLTRPVTGTQHYQIGSCGWTLLNVDFATCKLPEAYTLAQRSNKR